MVMEENVHNNDLDLMVWDGMAFSGSFDWGAGKAYFIGHCTAVLELKFGWVLAVHSLDVLSSK